jgi:hypothetical protein
VRLFSLIVFLITACFMNPVAADTVFLAQLGSYQSEQESEKAWTELKEVMGKALSGLTHQHSPLSLPPAGKKVYRLQAGSFVLRNEAGAFCEKLKNQGQDCFVVESAAFAPVDNPVKQLAEKEIVETPVKLENKPEKEMKEVSAASALPASLPDIRKGMVVATAAPAAKAIVEASPKPVSPALPSMTALAPEPFSLTKPVRPDAIQNEFAAAFTEEKPSAAPEKKAVAKVVAMPGKTQEASKPAVKAAVASNSLPWQKSDTLKTAKPVSVTKPQPPVSTPANAPVVVADAEVATAVPFAIIEKSSGKVIAPPNSKRIPVLPVPQKLETVEKTMATKLSEAAKPAEDKAVASVASISTPRQEQSAEKTIRYEQGREPKSLNAQRDSVTETRKIAAGDRISPTDRRVEIDEAIPVPLSEMPAKPAMEAQKEAVANTPQLSGEKPLAWGATPSRSLMQKSLWVQLSHFEDNAAAIRYWQGIRRQFLKATEGMRMRLVKPLTARTRKLVSLQVGPFRKDTDVTELCQYVASESLSCQMVKDIGTSTRATAVTATRSREAERYQDRRDVLLMRPEVKGDPRYWLQLGTYRSAEEAALAWDELRDTQPALQPYQPAIVKPRLSSSTEENYRLRAGAFQIRTEAENVCKQLVNLEIGCVIVSQ